MAHRTAAIVATLLIGACAQAPSAIAPAQVNEAQYYGLTCRELAKADARLNPALAALYTEQSQSRTDDVIGYLTTLMPLASISNGDLRYQIALRKGEREAIGRIMARNCPSFSS